MISCHVYDSFIVTPNTKQQLPDNMIQQMQLERSCISWKIQKASFTSPIKREKNEKQPTDWKLSDSFKAELKCTNKQLGSICFYFFFLFYLNLYIFIYLGNFGVVEERIWTRFNGRIYTQSEFLGVYTLKKNWNTSIHK